MFNDKLLHKIDVYISISNFSTCRNTPKTEEDWIHLLQQQESLHNIEMRKWQRVLHTAAQLLRQVKFLFHYRLYT